MQASFQSLLFKKFNDDPSFIKTIFRRLSYDYSPFRMTSFGRKRLTQFTVQLRQLFARLPFVNLYRALVVFRVSRACPRDR